MTGALPDPDERQKIRDLVAKLLYELGGAENAVAATLHAGGHLGELAECETCPVANYVRAGLLAADWTPDVIKVSRFDVQLGWHGVAPDEDDLYMYVDLPSPVWRFIARFDLGDHSQLRAS